MLFTFFKVNGQNWTEVKYDNTSNPTLGIGRFERTQILQTNSSDHSTLTVYGASAGSGLWKSSINTSKGYGVGDYWDNLTVGLGDGLKNIAVTEFVVDAINPSYIYIATDYPDSATVYRTSDGGATWTNISPPGSMKLQTVNKLLFVFNDPNQIYVATNDGVLKLTNARGTPIWNRMPSPLDHYMFNNIIYKPNPTASANTMYTSGDEIYQSVNGGAWESLSGAGKNLDYVAQCRRFYVDAGVNSLYAFAFAANSACQMNMNSPKILFRYNPTTSVWDSKGSPGSTGAQDNGFFYYRIKVKPNDDNIVYAAGTQLHIFNDNNATKWTNNQCYTMTTMGTGDCNEKAHGDMHDLQFNAYDANNLYVAHDAGLSWLDLSTSTWNMGANQNLGTIQIHYISTSPVSGTNKFLIGLQDCGSILYDNTAPIHWKSTDTGGDGDATLIYSDQLMFATVYISGVGDYLCRSSDGGNTFPGTGQVANKIKSNPSNNAIYIGSDTELKICTNFTSFSFMPISGFVSNFGIQGIKDFAVAPFNPKYIYAICNNRAFKTSTGGGTAAGDWSEITPSNIPGSVMVGVEVDPLNPDHVILLYQYYFSMESYDGGANWADYSTGLPSYIYSSGSPSYQMWDIQAEIGSNCGLYVSTIQGVYYRNKSMNSWQPFQTGMPPINVHSLDINYVDNKIVAGSTRGAWVSPLFCPPNNPLSLVNTVSNYDYNETGSFINSTQTINTGAFEINRAGTYIDLNPGFVANTGSNFLAYIHNCGTTGNSLKLQAVNENLESNLAMKEENSVVDSFEVSAYPNPSIGDVFLKSNLEMKEIAVYDSKGVQVINLKNINKREYELDLRQQEDGVYLVNVILNGKIVNKKIILNHAYNEENEEEEEEGRRYESKK